MLRVITDEEESIARREQFEQLARPGQLFDLAQLRYFIFVARTDDSVKALELNAENRNRILQGAACAHITLNFEQMRGLNVHAAKWSNIQSTPGVRGGVACVGRTRIPVWLLEQALRCARG